MAGLTTYGTPLGITQISAAQMQSAVSGFSNAAAAYAAARTNAQTVRVPYQDASEALLTWVKATKAVFMARFGGRWSAQWIQVGFISPSLSIPQSYDKYAALALSMVNCLKANVTWQVSNLGVTSTVGAATIATAATALSASQMADGAAIAKGQTNETTRAALVLIEGNLIKILQATLAADDQRWLAFGLPMPISQRTPEQPIGLTAQMNEEGDIAVACSPTLRARRYRWRTLLVGIETEYTLAASEVPPMALLSGFDPGAVVSIIVQGVNGNTEGVASEPLVFTVPVLVLRTALPATSPVLRTAIPATPEAAAKSKELKPPGNGNGHGNGHGHAVAGNGRARSFSA